MVLGALGLAPRSDPGACGGGQHQHFVQTRCFLNLSFNACSQILNSATGIKSQFSLNDWIKPDTSQTIPLSSTEQIYHDYSITVIGMYNPMTTEGCNARSGPWVPFRSRC